MNEMNGGGNPFAKAFADAVESAEVASDTSTTPEGDGAVSELFEAAPAPAAQEPEAAVDGADGDDDEPLFEEVAKPDATMKVSTFQKRLGKVISQRELEKESRIRAEAERDTHRQALADFRAVYAENPDLARFDVRFMEAIQGLSAEHADVAEVAQAVADFVNTGEFKGVKKTVSNQTPDKKTEAPASDARLDKIIERDARQLAGEALETVGVKPAFVKLLTDHVVKTHGDLASLSASDVKRISREYLKDNGFSPAEVLKSTKAAEKDTTTKKPATTGSGAAKAATTTKGAGDGKGDDGRPAAPKDRNEWEARRADRVREFFSNVQSS
jgi:hypothetical protein